MVKVTNAVILFIINFILIKFIYFQSFKWLKKQFQCIVCYFYEIIILYIIIYKQYILFEKID